MARTPACTTDGQTPVMAMMGLVRQCVGGHESQHGSCVCVCVCVCVRKGGKGKDRGYVAVCVEL